MAKFSITGELLTDRIRDLWQSKDYKKAINLGLESLDGAMIDHIVSIIDGNMKLVGIGILDLVDDGAFSPDVSFMDVLNYATIPNSGYFRIYEDDCRIAEEILEYFDSTYPDSLGDDRRQQYIRQWNNLMPEVKLDYRDRITHWMLVYMRKNSDYQEVRLTAGLYSKNIVSNNLSLNPTREEFDRICDKHLIYSDREECWESAIHLRSNILKEPLQKIIKHNIKEEYLKYKSDITMKSEYGWLSPDGRYTVCEWAGHEVCAQAICDYLKYDFTQEQKIGGQLSDVLLSRGYVKIHRDDIGIFRITHNRKLTYDQELKLDRYKAVHGIDD